MEITTLTIKQETRAKLYGLKLVPMESADHLLNRLMDGYSKK